MTALLIIKRVFEFIKRRLFLILWISLNTFLFYDTFMLYLEGRQFYYLRQILGYGLCVARGSAAVINLCCALVLLPLCRKLSQLLHRGMAKVCPGLFFFWLERTKCFHMTVAITLFICSVIHSIAHCVNVWNFSRKFDEVHPDINMASYKNENPLALLLTIPGMTGVFMLTILTLMYIASLRVVRRKIYNVFWYTHQLYLPFLLLLIIHPLSGALKQEDLESRDGTDISHLANDSFVESHKFVPIKTTNWMWLVFPLSCFLIDLMWRICQRNRAEVEILKVNSMAGRVLGLTLSCPHEGFSCRAGQYVLLQCPDISLLEWHPFTVVKVPTANERYFIVWIKVIGDWTEALEDLLLERSKDNVKLLVDGPMVSPMERVSRCRVAICVAAGVGVTPFVPILYQLLNKPRGELPWRVHLLWIVRSEREASVLGDLITQCLQELMDNNRPDGLQVQIHITRPAQEHCAPAVQTIVNDRGQTYVVKEESDSLLASSVSSVPSVVCTKDEYSFTKDYPVLGCRLRGGRPDWDQVFREWVHLYPKNDLTLLCCGPKKLVNTLRIKCRSVSLTTKTKISFIHERFS